MNLDIQYRFMHPGEEASVCSLIENVFNEFVAPDYDLEGINEFFKFANLLAMTERAGMEQVIVVAERKSDLVGIIEMRKCEHIALLFVSYHGRGIAKELIKKAVEECCKRQPDIKTITVNSSLFAEPVYSRMGFKATGLVQEKNGITFVPMVCHMG